MKKLLVSYLISVSTALIVGLSGENAEPINITELAEPVKVVFETTETHKEIKCEEKIQEIPQDIAPDISLDVFIEEKEYRYIKECPLSEELQQGIFDICEENNISFEFVMSVIAQESSFRPNVLGDNEKSKGLMQIQERYHNETMKELGVTDLFDPIGNVEVGVNILRGYFEELDDVYHVLMRYNGGEPYATNMIKAGKVSDYAKEITERAIIYEEENGI